MREREIQTIYTTKETDFDSRTKLLDIGKRKFNSAQEESRIRYDEVSNILITLCEWATRT